MKYEAPESLDGAVSLLAGGGPRGRVLAGGTDLLVQLRASVISPDVIIDIKGIGETREIRENDGVLVVGAAVTGAELGEHATARLMWPGVVEALELIGSTQIQGRASLAGNLCNASPAADTVPALISAAATCTVAGPSGTRNVPVEDVCTGPGQLSLGDGEFVVAFELPKPPPRSADAYLRFIPRTEMDIAVVGAGVSLSLDEDGWCTAARVTLGAVAPTCDPRRGGGRGADRHRLRRRRDRGDGRRRARRLPPDRRQARHRRVPDEGRGVLAARAARIAVERARNA